MHLKILLFIIIPQMLLFASDTKSCRQACEKAKPLCKNGCFRRSCIDIAFSDLLCFLGVWCGAVFVVGWFCFFCFCFVLPVMRYCSREGFFFFHILEEMENKKDFSHPPCSVESPSFTCVLWAKFHIHLLYHLFVS